MELFLSSWRNIYFFTIIFLLAHQINTYLYAVQTTYEVRDLYSKNQDMGEVEATTTTLVGSIRWSVSSAWNTIYSTCPGLVLVGGYQSIGSGGSNPPDRYYYKKFENLPSHSRIYYTLTVYAIDSWTSTDSFDVRFDDTTAWSGPLPQYSVYSFYQNYCGGSTNDLANIRVFGSITHSDTSVTLQIYHLMAGSSSVKSVAFRDVNLLFVNNPLSPPADGSCVVSDVAPLTSTACSCREGLYLLAGSCVPCDPLCASCFGGSPRQCYQCRPGASLMGSPSQCTACSTGCSTCSDATETGCNTCLDGYYLFTPSATSKSCVNSCNYPLINSTDATGTYLKCASPCAATDFVYWDQSCNSTCDAPLQQNTLIKFVKTCTFPCADDEFLMWDGSCSATCKEPLLQGTYRGRFFCYYTCPISTPQYLYWNGTCADKCMFPFKIQTSHGRLFCVHICDGAEYLYWNGSCHADCPSPLTSRVVDGNLYCDYGCLPTEYLYWDSSCELTCPYPLTTEIQGTVKPRQFCKYLGALTTYLYWNATYPSSCPLPLTTKVYKNRNFCIYPCTSTEILLWNTTCVPFAFCTNGLLVRSEPGALFCDYPCDPSEFLYWDDVCDTACPPPLTQSVVGGTQPRYYCNFGNCAATEYLYWNSSCLTDCPTYHYTTTPVHSRSLCHFPCDFTQFLYYDGTCKLNCPLPYAPRYTAEMNYCDYPCLSTQYLYQNGSCLYSCDFPMLLVNGPAGEKWCNPPCSDPLQYYNMETQTCQAACNHDAKIENVTYLRCLPYVYVSPTGWMDMLLTASADPRAPSFISFHKLSQYVRFVDIDMPPRLEKFVKNQANIIISWDLGFGVPESLGRKITQQNLPTAFERSRVSSSFMANFWSEIIFFGSIVLLTCLLKILEKSVEVFEWHEFAPAIAKIRTIFMWNFCFVLIGYYGDDIILYTCLDIMSMNLDSTPATVSLFLSMFFLILLIGVLILNAYVLYQYRQLKQHIIVDPSVEDERTEEFHKKWNFCLIFYREFRDDTWYQQSFYLIYVLRMVIPIFLVVLTNKIPLAQTIFELIVSISILTFIIWKQPLKRTINHIQLLCYEIGTLIITISALLLASIKPKGTGDEPNSHVRTFLGDLIILGNVYLNITAVVFWVVKAAFEIKNLYTFYKGQYSTERAPWVRLLVIFLQQPAFGFEEMLELNTIDTVPLELAKERQSLTIEKERAMVRKQRNSRKLSQVSPAPTTPSSEYGKESDLAPQNYVVNNFEPLKLGSPLDLSRASSIKSIERFRSSMRRGAQPALQVQDQIILEDPEEAEMPNATEMINSPVDLHIPGSSLGSGPGSTPIPRNGYESNRRSRVVSHLNSGRETPTLAEALRKYG